MKVKKLLPIILSVITFAFVLSGCSDFDNGWTEKELKYRESFANAFGKIDPEQDWNLATRAAVTVTTGSPTDVKIFAKKGDKYKIVGDYAQVDGTKTLGFDVQKGISDILVTNGETSFFTKIGESVNFLSTRTAHSTDTRVTVATNYKDFDFSYVQAVIDLLPEGSDNTSKVTENFSYVSTGPFTIYPIYWNTSSVHTMGVYYKNASGNYVAIPIYDTRVGDELAKKELITGESMKCEDAIVPYIGAIGKEWPNPEITKVEGGKGYYYSEIECTDNFYAVGMKCSANEHTISRISVDSQNGNYIYWYSIPSPYEEECGNNNFSVGETCSHGFKITKKDGNLAYHNRTENVCEHDNTHTWQEGDHCCMGHEIASINDGHKYYNGYIEWTGTIKPVVGASCVNDHIIDYVDASGNAYHNSKFNYNYKTTFENNAAFTTGETVGSKGITINLPTGTQFGFYLDVYDAENYADDKMSFTGQTYYHTVYSQAEVNKEYAGKNSISGKTPPSSWAGTNQKGTYVFGSTFNRIVKGQDTKYICFEDWNMENPDLQDLVFVIDGDTPPVVVDEDAEKWIICAEDLGNNFDLDYNDVVVAASHISGRDKATIAPLAAGGTLASYLYFDSQCLGEVHEILGANNTNSGKYSPINVNGSVNAAYVEFEVPVPTTWSLASSSVYESGNDWTYTGDAAMGGFTVKVVPEGEASTEQNAAGGQTIQSNFSNGNQTAPYVICVPMEWERSDAKGWFRWPNENTPISPLTGYSASAYHTSGHTFADWVSDHTKNDWFMYPDESNTTGLQGVISIAPVQPGDDNNDDDNNDDDNGSDPYEEYGTKVTGTISHGYAINGDLFTSNTKATITMIFSTPWAQECNIVVNEKWYGDNYATANPCTVLSLDLTGELLSSAKEGKVKVYSNGSGFSSETFKGIYIKNE